MSDFKTSVHTHLKQFDSRYSNNKYLQQLEDRTKVPKSYIVGGLASIYVLMMFINPGGLGEMLSNFVGFLLPAYYSLVALKTPGGEDDSQLLIYWVVFSFFSVLEFWSSALTYIIPFYWLLKTAFLVYIAVPTTGGALMIYNKVIDPATAKFVAPARGPAASHSTSTKTAAPSHAAPPAHPASTAQGLAHAAKSAAQSSGIASHIQD